MALSHLFINLAQGSASLGEKREVVFENFLQILHRANLPTPVSLEILGKNGYAYFFVSVEKSEQKTVESLIYASFPDCEIVPQNDPFERPERMAGHTIELIRSDIFALKSYTDFEGCSIASLISVIEKTGGDIWLSIVIEKQSSSASYFFRRGWARRFFEIRDRLSPRNWFHPEIRGIRAKGYAEAKEKTSIANFHTSIQFATEKEEDRSAIFRAFTPFGRTDIQEFVRGEKISGETLRKRTLIDSFLLSKKEISSIYHYPNADFTSHIVHLQSRRGEPPRDLAKTQDSNGSVSFFGRTNYHGSSDEFGITQPDRKRHLYLVGKSGSGKSKCLELLIKADLEAGRGIGLLDPHGDLVDNVLRMVPEHRKKDIVIFDPSDSEAPVAFNPVELISPELKMQVTVGFISIFKRLFGTTWTPRLEHVLRYTVLALLDTPGTTTLSILKMLTDKNYRQMVVSRIDDAIVKNFWVSEFAGWSEKFDAEAITPLLNKVGQFVATDMIRNIVGQPKSAFNIRKMMDEQKILLVKVSKGLLGEENSGLLGSMFVTKIYEAAMSRADMREEDRKDFMLYVDEFQNFATDTFAEILSEARKYALCLTIAHQYMGQLTPVVQKTVFGNVGSMISFRVGADDAKVLAEEYAPVFSERDIINLGVREFYAKLSVGGEIREAFSGSTLSVSYQSVDPSAEIKALSRKTYGTPKEAVKKLLSQWDESGTFEAPKEGQKGFVTPML